ncbi:Multiple epidermal growth factor-like domains protein 8 [Mortierella alpina]|nr:Multiple epidermal growth factor-like domains protein 8 [Mortierella alpina]
MYPSQNRTCVWTIHAAPSSSRDTPYVIQVNFSTPIQLICGTDYLTLYDGPDTTSPRIAVICGQIWPDNLPVFYSTGQELTAVFTSQERSPGSFGFTAVWTSVAPCSICSASGRGTCTNGNTCACNNGYNGVVCESEFKEFVARSQHAMAYDAAKDMVYIMGGTSLKNSMFWDMFSYHFGTNKWSKIDAGPKKPPSPRYGHFAFVHNSDVYVYGGITSIGGVADLWRFNVTGGIWDPLQAINQEKLPVGRAGSACVVVTNNNSTKLYVFGGLDSKGVMSRDLNYYDIGQTMWRKLDHQNSVGLAGATAVYHKATDSIYYFGGMVNPTTRNVLTYQYKISQDLWYALAPRVDPFTAHPAQYWSSSHFEPSSPVNSTDDDSEPNIGQDSGAEVSQNTTAQYLPPVMYDQVTAVWSPAALLGDDSVVMYGGMRPFGPGLNERDQSCFVKGFSIFDLSCQTWTTYEAPELSALPRGRANHTMVIRPPGSPGGSQTAWTAYIFGGFNGVDHADVLSVALNVSTNTPEAINSCRALRWCSLYDDCPNCNLSYCSYVNGLCLFDTDKAKESSQLLGTAMDIPKTGTVQDLLRQRPELQKVQSIEGCPERESLVLGNPFARTLDPDKEKSFIIYIDAHDLNIRFEVRTYPSMMLSFKTLNVWEGFMNMYWRADHGLTDGSWDGSSWTSSPIPSDIPNPWDNAGDVGDGPVITPAGFLNASELMNRWTKYSGLDASVRQSALRRNTSYIYFPANDPRRFSGYYVFSLTNHNPTPISYSLTVTLMDHPTPVDKPKSTSFNMATLAFFMLGFVLAIALLVFMGRKIRQLVEDRDAAHRAAEMQMLEEDEEERNRNGRGNGGGMNLNGEDGSMLLKKPMYRVVIGVQDMGRNASGMLDSQLRQRIVRGDGPVSKKYQEKSMMHGATQPHDKDPAIATRSGANSDLGHPEEDAVSNSSESGMKHSRVRSDYIRDIGSAPLLLPDSLNAMADSDGSELIRSFSMGDSRQSTFPVRDHEPPAAIGARSRQSVQCGSRHVGERIQPNTGKTKKTPAATEQTVPDGGNGLHRGWSLKSLRRSASLKRHQSHPSRISPEERKGLTSLDVPEENESTHSRNSSRCYDSEQEMVDLSRLTAQTDLLQARQEELERYRRQAEEDAAAAALNIGRRNPIKVQPISIEPLPFQTGLVPRTMAHLKRYQRNLAKQQQRQELRRQQLAQDLDDDDDLRSSGSIHVGAETMRQREGSVRRGGENSVGSVRSTRSARRRPALGHSSSSSSSVTAAHRTPSRQVRAVQSQGSLRELHKKASRMTLRTNGEAAPKSAVELQLQTEPWRDGMEGDLEAGIELRQLVGSRSIGDREQQQPQQQQREERSEPAQVSALRDAPVKRKPIKMRGRQEYEPGPLLAMNILIVFPGDAGSRRVHQQGDALMEDRATDDGAVAGGTEEQRMKLAMMKSDDTLYNTEKRLPPMAIGTVFVPDPVRWWAYKAKQQLDRRRFERQMRRRMLKHEQKQQQQQQQQGLQRPSPAKTR